MNTFSCKRHYTSDSLWYRILEKINRVGSRQHTKPGIRPLAGRIINMLCARAFDTSTLVFLTIKRRTMKIDIGSIMSRETADVVTNDEKAERLCGFVYDNIAYGRSIYWMHPEDTLRLRYGDCKCHAMLLHRLMNEAQIQTEIVVGITGRQEGFGRIHAWVEYKSDSDILVCDPALFRKPVARQEYVRIMGGVMDVTHEYMLKRPDVKDEINTSNKPVDQIKV